MKGREVEKGLVRGVRLGEDFLCIFRNEVEERWEKRKNEIMGKRARMR